MKHSYLSLRAFRAATLALLLVLLSAGLPAQEPFAQLVEIIHACGGQGGAIEFELTGDAGDYTYYWTHGPTILRIEDLEPGTYTLIVRDFYGCEQVFTATVLLLDNCWVQYEVLPSKSCIKEVKIRVFSGSAELGQESLDISWSGGLAAGPREEGRQLCRQVDTRRSNEVCVTISPKGSAGKCCVLQECIPVSGERDCAKYTPITPVCRLLINEIGGRGAGQRQFVELAVEVEGGCECDLRGFMLDDNNGELIPASSFISEKNLAQIAVNEGFLVFRQEDRWAAVPNGSLIVIYDEQGPTTATWDPTDADADGVYVLSADDVNAFKAQTGRWDARDLVLAYEGLSRLPSWSFVRMDAAADGMQSRYPGGTFCHGISHGSPPLAGKNSFPLWYGQEAPTNCHCSLVKADPLRIDDYDCGEGNASPGQANSAQNAAWLEALKNCDPKLYFQATPHAQNNNDHLTARGEERLRVYPNPFLRDLTLEYYAPETGWVDVIIYTVAGQAMYRTTYEALRGLNRQVISFDKKGYAGVFILQFTFPSGQQRQVRLVGASLD